MQILLGLLKDESGATLVEYGIAIGVAIAIGATGFSALANAISTAIGLPGSLMPS